MYIITLEFDFFDCVLQSLATIVPLFHVLWTFADIPDIDLSHMPPLWIEQLYQAAAKGSDQRVLHLIEQIPADCAPLANVLTDLANNFQFDQLMALTQQQANP